MDGNGPLSDQHGCPDPAFAVSPEPAPEELVALAVALTVLEPVAPALASPPSASVWAATGRLEARGGILAGARSGWGRWAKQRAR